MERNRPVVREREDGPAGLGDGVAGASARPFRFVGGGNQ